MSDPVVGRASPFKARGPFRAIGAPFRGIGVWGRYGPRTNSIRNNTMVGAVAGTPGTLPTNWVASNLSGLTREVIGAGTDAGLSYIDVKLSGTSGAAYSNSAWINFEGANTVVAASGQVWAASVYVSLVGGSMTNAELRVRISESNGSSSLANSSTTFTPTAVQRRFIVSRTLNNASTTHVQPLISVNIANGAAVDFTVRIAAPQLERGIGATSPIATSGAAASRVADVLAGAY